MRIIKNRRSYVRSEIRQTLNQEVRFYRKLAEDVRTHSYATNNQICNLIYPEEEKKSSILSHLF